MGPPAAACGPGLKPGCWVGALELLPWLVVFVGSPLCLASLVVVIAGACSDLTALNPPDPQGLQHKGTPQLIQHGSPPMQAAWLCDATVP
jgi:hypothetical protein